MFLNMDVLQGGVVSTSPNPQAGGPPLVGCLRLLIQFIRNYPPYRRPLLYPQPDAPCRGDPLDKETAQLHDPTALHPVERNGLDTAVKAWGSFWSRTTGLQHFA